MLPNIDNTLIPEITELVGRNTIVYVAHYYLIQFKLISPTMVFKEVISAKVDRTYRSPNYSKFCFYSANKTKLLAG